MHAKCNSVRLTESTSKARDSVEKQMTLHHAVNQSPFGVELRVALATPLRYWSTVQRAALVNP